MDNTLRDALVVEVRHLLPEVEVLHQSRTPLARLQGIVRMIDADAVIGREILIFAVSAVRLHSAVFVLLGV